MSVNSWARLREDSPFYPPIQFDQVARLVVQQCDPHYPLEQAKSEKLECGLPLRAKHVSSVSTDSRYFL